MLNERQSYQMPQTSTIMNEGHPHHIIDQGNHAHVVTHSNASPVRTVIRQSGHSNNPMLSVQEIRNSEIRPELSRDQPVKVSAHVTKTPPGVRFSRHKSIIHKPANMFHEPRLIDSHVKRGNEELVHSSVLPDIEH